MLSYDPQMRVINRVYGNEASFLTDLSAYCPDVILLNETHLFSRKRILALLPQVSLSSGLRVIVINLANNNVHIFDHPGNQMNRQDGVQYVLTQPTDWNELFDLIGGNS
jgi:hypothetical protein